MAFGSHGTWFVFWGEDDGVYDLKRQYRSMLETIQVSKPQNIKASDEILLVANSQVDGS